MTLTEARAKHICRICEQPVKMLAPARVFDCYADLEWPSRVTLNFGKEFAHTECVEGATEMPEELF